MNKHQPDSTVIDLLAAKFPTVATMLTAKADLCAFADFPDPHWHKILSNNPSNG
ncbi:hypothetical protein E0504_46640 [Parafrankia sp. BMG5.11]|nr:hypothetical protein E0504_46640 [Parafrankia sp. BMG5.11]